MVIRLVKPCKFHHPLYKTLPAGFSSLTVHFPVSPLFRTSWQTLSRSLLPLGSAPCFLRLLPSASFSETQWGSQLMIFSGQYWNWAQWSRRRSSSISSACCLLHSGLFCMQIEVLLACRNQRAFPWKSFPLLKLLSFQIESHPGNFPYQLL